METLKYDYLTADCARKEDTQYSDFEESSDSGPSIEDALKNNLELMKKREDFLMSQLKRNKILIYDAKTSKFSFILIYSNTTNITSFDTQFLQQEDHFPREVHNKNIPRFLPMKACAIEYTTPSFDEGVIFDSSFENANLKKVFRVSLHEYELYLSEDYNTTGHYHWFHFKTISSLPVGTVVEFCIVNMVKPSSLYSVGFRPFAYSVKGNKEWIYAGTSISYAPTEGQIESFGKKKKFYTLKWKYTYEYANDEVYFAQFIPYTFTDLISYLRGIKERSEVQSIVRMESLCKTLAGNDCPLLTITDNISTYTLLEQEIINKAKKEQSKIALKYNTMRQTETNTIEVDIGKCREEHEKKKGIVITARVHPGNCKLIFYR